MTAVADVRSDPVSRYCPQYDREPLAAASKAEGIRYVYLGRELGARREEPECYAGGVARYDLIARAPLFRQGLDRVRRGVEAHRVALLCAEKDPLVCHRMILVCRHLRGDVGPIAHIREDGSAESHADAEARLLALCKLDADDPSLTRTEWVERAYNMQAARIAYMAAGGSPPAVEVR
ncbi:MAG: DUF488 domain-containing protein [Gemmataceae bacterium]|nr:DUF488 domain-containing protein [Gemmataceae bacterium]